MTSLRFVLFALFVTVLASCGLNHPTQVVRLDVPSETRDVPPDLGPCGTPGTRCCPATASMDAGASSGCQAGAICAMGQCAACPAGQIVCGNQCVDPNASNDHCGTCGNRCPAGMGCVRGGADGGTARCNVICPMGQTECNGVCVTPATDVNNCGACGTRCATRIANANTACMNGACRLASCLAGFDNCDGMETNGCEVNTTSDAANCGSCGNRCMLPNATAGCTAGRCTVAMCNAGFADCNGNPMDGCETDTRTTVAHCGRCGNACSAPAGRTPLCNAGACGMSAVCTTPGTADCDGDPTMSCETNTTTSVMHCGGCGRPCSSNGGVPLCSGSTCSIRCNAGFGDCDMNVNTGCETNTSTSVLHCGACGNACDLPNASEACIGGMCQIASCNAGFADCDRLARTGCEQQLMTDTSNCGACANRCRTGEVCQAGACVCPIAGQTYCTALSRCVDLLSDVANCGACGTACTGGQTCQSGMCRCPAGTTLCNGTCVNLQTDVSHCGACNTACNLANARAACATGSCVVMSCNAGFANCDGVPTGGCEVNTNTDNNNCGRCGTQCGAGRFCSNGTCVACGSAGAPACQPGSTCSGGSTNCTGTCRDLQNDSSNCGACGRACAAGQSCCAGVCRAVTTDTAHCGTCNNVCPTPTNAAAACTSGLCGLGACNAGFANCDMNAANGCEANLGTNVSHCGMCGRACTAANGTAGCAASACTVASCNSGFANCNNSAADGCEINTQTDPANCNGCGMRCSLPNVMAANCAAGTCGVGACNTGFANCDNNPVNGCEVNTTTSTAHCGGCGRECNFANAAETCVGSTCTLGACTAGFGNCDASAANGCETDLRISNAHCGMCGMACSASQVCVNSTCVSCGTPGAACCTGNVCSGGAACSGGTCACPSGQMACGTTCVNTQTDSNNCGGCGTVCMGGRTCQAGTCSCPGGQMFCGGMCRNLQSDNSNCGSCGNVCPTNSACMAGACVCMISGQTRCGTGASQVCVNLQTSSTHCGMCDRACTSGQECMAGACVACGGSGEACCTGMTCPGGANLSCQSGMCQACGAMAGQPCCPGNVCNMGLTCMTGTCQAMMM